MSELDYADIEAAATRVAGRVRRTPVIAAGPGVYYSLEFMQHTGSFKARGAQNFIRAHRERGTLPDAGITIASGGNAGLANAWAAQAEGVCATVFLPATAPSVKVERLRSYGADVRLVGTQYADALAACEEFTAHTGALASHAYDDPYVAAGAGTLLLELREAIPGLDTLVVAVGGGGLFSGISTAARHFGIRTVAVEPETCRALNAALEAGQLVDVAVDSVAVDSLGARRASEMALRSAGHDDVSSLLVSDAEIVQAREGLWADHRLAVEHAAATALAGLNHYNASAEETVCVVLCGANTDPATL
ncbi:L-threonine dehydratase catabolic TdcB [Corynebacterium capitovis DSM 44611]|uniref:threonine/serine dehydratase n=1 Tax=Corynebacterium capitovis TaxID=131081 RepID=UPI0003A084F0|nr:threonine/serine dehydratase [Corynebacterium capitovis]WKD58029.1 L-threonine dehydratase catabolic TdcB [Corynebacterium capitovis DSM 44611]